MKNGIMYKSKVWLLSYLLGMFLILPVPRYLGVIVVRPEYVIFRNIIDYTITIALAITIIYSFINVVNYAYNKTINDIDSIFNSNHEIY